MPLTGLGPSPIPLDMAAERSATGSTVVVAFAVAAFVPAFGVSADATVPLMLKDAVGQGPAPHANAAEPMYSMVTFVVVGAVTPGSTQVTPPGPVTPTPPTLLVQPAGSV